MQKKLEEILDTTRKIYLSVDDSFHNFCDVTLSVIAWHWLSVDEITTGILKITTTPRKYSIFTALDNKHNVPDIHTTLNETLKYWDEVLQEQLQDKTTLLELDSAIIKSIPEDRLQFVLHRWRGYFHMFPFDDRGALSEFWTHIENYFTPAYSKENAYLAPSAIISAMTQYISSEDENLSVYDPCARSGNLLAKVQHNVPGIQEVAGISSARLSWKLAAIRLLFTGARSTIHLSEPGRNFATDDAFDIILSNPPYGDSPGNMNMSIQDSQLFEIAWKSKRLEVVYLSHILDRLSDSGRAAVLLPFVFLSGGSTIKELMAYILHHNILDVVVEFPQGLFRDTAVAPVLLFFDKKREAGKSIILIDATNEVFKSGRQLYLNEKKLQGWLQQVRNGNIPDEKNIIRTIPDEVMTADYNLYKLLHHQEKEDNKKRKPAAELLAKNEQIKNELVALQREIATFIQQYNN